MRYRLVSRKVINKILDNIYNYPYTVITAPIGYGKSTAVREFLKVNKKQYIWLSVGTKQTCADYIWDRFTMQIKNSFEELGGELNKFGFPENHEQRLKVINLIKNSMKNEAITLVIDDYQLISNDDIDNFLLSLVLEEIPNFHIVVISRGEPNTNTQELEIKGLCNKIEQDKFEFTKDDIKEYFLSNNCIVSDDKFDEIYNYTEGWIAAIYLVMMEIIKFGDFRRENTLDKLIEHTVFLQYDKESQDLLLKLSILDSYTMEQAIYITNSRKTANLLWDLCNYNSFFKYDSTTKTYKPHNILNNYLYQKMKRSLDIDENELLNRAGKWCVSHGDIILGFSYLNQVKNYEDILEELSKPGAVHILEKYSGTIDDILNAIPEEIKIRYPLVIISYVYWLTLIKNSTKGYYVLDYVEKYYNENFNKNDEEYKAVLGEVYLAKAMLARDTEEFSMYMKLVKENLRGISQIATSESTFTFVQPLLTMTLHRQIGRYNMVAELLTPDMKYFIEVLNGNPTCMEQLLKAEYYVEKVDLKSALICAKEAIYEGEILNKPSMIIAANLVILRICLYNNDLLECESIFNKLEQIEDKKGILKKYFILDMCKSYIYSRFNSINKFPSRFLDGEMFRKIKRYKLYSLNYVTECDALLAQDKFIELKVIANNFILYAQEENLQLAKIYSLTYKAIAINKIYGLDHAKVELVKALKIAQEDNVIMLLAELAPHILDIIYSIKDDNIINSNYMDELIFHSTKYYNNVNGNNKKYKNQDESKINILTNREKEVLKLISLGKSNKEVAKELFISEYTVKTILSNIYKKTEVKGRIEAIKLLG